MQVNMLEAKNRLSSLIVAAEQGEEVLIARNGVPVARIVPYVSLRVKPPGTWKGLVPYSTDWRSAETDREIERLFYGEEMRLLLDTCILYDWMRGLKSNGTAQGYPTVACASPGHRRDDGRRCR